ncbi:MAG: GntR family transcriptional regulator [Candidatus Marinimicrobia bacterium]|nr:GntR family transcriptional regulator [Candidatus Neomarinimicrobiota bacterium]
MTARRICLYQRIAAKLRDDMLAGAWAPGALLPTEQALGRTFNCSRITIRQALAILEDEGLLVRRRGSGTYVSPRPSRRIPLQIDYTGSMQNHAPRLRRQVLAKTWRPAEIADAAPLGLTAGARILYTERLDRLGAQPVAFDRGVIPAPFAQSLTRTDLAQIAFLETWARRMHLEFKSCRQSIEAVACPPAVAAHLGLTPGAPVLLSTELYAAAPGPVGLFTSYYHPRHICITSHYHWGRAPAAGHITQ